MVERIHGKDEVTGSIPVCGSIMYPEKDLQRTFRKPGSQIRKLFKSLRLQTLASRTI